MADTKLKEKLYKRLESIEDDILIQSVLNLIEIESDDLAKIHFDDNQIQLIEEARVSVRKTGVSNQEVFSKNREWLKK